MKLQESLLAAQGIPFQLCSPIVAPNSKDNFDQERDRFIDGHGELDEGLGDGVLGDQLSNNGHQRSLSSGKYADC
jgi:hypothetical protein